MEDLLKDYSIEECANMPREQFNTLLEIHNQCFDEEVKLLREAKEMTTEFSSIEEIMKYYNAIPLDELINNGNKMFGV